MSIAQGKGCWLFDREGNRYLDVNASTWTNVHGHGESDLNEAIVEQLGSVAYSTYLGLAHDPATLLSKRLAESSPTGLEKVFYSENGSTSVEVDLALLRNLRAIGATGMTRLFANHLRKLMCSYDESFRGEVGTYLTWNFFRLEVAVCSE